jgi:hypothetical protein
MDIVAMTPRGALMSEPECFSSRSNSRKAMIREGSETRLRCNFDALTTAGSFSHGTYRSQNSDTIELFAVTRSLLPPRPHLLAHSDGLLLAETSLARARLALGGVAEDRRLLLVVGNSEFVGLELADLVAEPPGGLEL